MVKDKPVNVLALIAQARRNKAQREAAQAAAAAKKATLAQRFIPRKGNR